MTRRRIVTGNINGIRIMMEAEKVSRKRADVVWDFALGFTAGAILAILVQGVL